MILSTDTNIKALAAVFNALRAAGGQPEVSAETLGKRGKGKVLTAIQEMAGSIGFDLNEGASVAYLAEHGWEAHKAEAKRLADEETARIQAKAAEEAAAKAAEKTKPANKKPKGEKKEKGPVIRHVAEKLLLEVASYDEDKRPFGHTYEFILDNIREQFPNAKTTVACLRWYAVHMREDGQRVPHRPRAAAQKQPKKGE